MIKKIVSIPAVAVALMLAASAALATDAKPFDKEAFAQAKADGKTVLVDFHANWCPVCKKQAEVIPGVLQQDKFKNVVVFVADYDTEKALKKELRITGQSTLVLFKGDKEVARERGVTDPSQIAGLLSKGL